MRTTHSAGRSGAWAAGRGRPRARACTPHCWQATARTVRGARGQRQQRTVLHHRRTTAIQAVSFPFSLYQEDSYQQVAGHEYEQGHGAQSTTVEVRLSIQQEVTWGQVVGLVGSSHELGAWHCDGAVRLAWGEGHTWSTVLQLPAGTRLSYKYVILGGEHGPVWQEGPNLMLEAKAPGGLLEVVDVWDREAATRTIHTTGQSPAPSRSGSPLPSRTPSPWSSEQPPHRAGSLQGPEEVYAAARSRSPSPEPGRSSPHARHMPGFGTRDSSRSNSPWPAGVAQQQDARRSPSPSPAGDPPTPHVEVLGRPRSSSGRRRSWLAGPDTEQLLAEGLAALRSLQQQQQDTLAALQAPLPAAPWMDVLQGLGSTNSTSSSTPGSLASPWAADPAAGWAPWQAPLPLYGRGSPQPPSPPPPPAAAVEEAAEEQPCLHSSMAAGGVGHMAAGGVGHMGPQAAAAMHAPDRPDHGNTAGAMGAVEAAAEAAGAGARQAAPPSGRHSPPRPLASHDDIAAALCSDDYEDACHALADVLGSCSEEGGRAQADVSTQANPHAAAAAAYAKMHRHDAPAADSSEGPELDGRREHSAAPGAGAGEAVPQVMVTGNAAVGAATALASAGALSLGLPKAAARKAALQGVETALRGAWEVVREEADPGAPRVLEADRGLAAATAAMDRLLKA